MSNLSDTNAAIWKSDAIIETWRSMAGERERRRSLHWRLLAGLLPFDDGDRFTFLDLGAGTGAAARAVLDRYPGSTGVLTDFSAQMMQEGQRALSDYAGRFSYIEFDMSGGDWPEEIPTGFDAAVTSLCVHHLTDDRKQGLFAEILQHLAPGAWYFNYDPVRHDDPVVEAHWEATNDREDPGAAEKRLHRTAEEQARHENHVRYMIPLAPQLDYLRAAGFEGVDVYWKYLDDVIYGGRRPS